MSEQPTARRVVVHGDVQGVFFRDSTKQEADAAGVAGWVSNETDGTVLAHFEGPADAVETLVDYARHGPRRASVERVDVTDVPVDGLSGFQVR